MGFVSLTIFLLLFSWLLFRWKERFGLSPKKIFLGFGVKLFFSGLFYLIYAHHYGEGELSGDAANFYNDSKIIAQWGANNPREYVGLMFGMGAEDPQLMANELSETQIWDYGETEDAFNDNRFVIRLQSIIHFLSFDNVFVHLLFMAFLSYLGLLYLYRTFASHVSRKDLFFYALIGFPSIAFWGSGISKESIMIFGMGLYFFALLELLKKRSAKTTVLLVIAIFILLLNKPYVGLILIPVSCVIGLGSYYQWKSNVLYLWSGLILLSLFTLSFTPRHYNLVDRLSAKQKDLINIANGGVFFINDSSFCAFDYSQAANFQFRNNQATVLATTSGKYKLFGQSEFHPFEIQPSDERYELYLVQAPSNSYVEVPPINESGIQLVKNTPLALVNTIFRPIPGDVGNPLSHLVTLQNVLFLAFLIFVLLNRRKLVNQESYLVYSMICSAILILLLIGWTTPILGAIFRYKVAAELLLLVALFIWLKKPKMNAS